MYYTVKMALSEWEKVVNRVAREIVGRKRIVCGSVEVYKYPVQSIRCSVVRSV